MECERCKDIIESGEEREYAGRVLCEDCYMDALSPAKSCDPWAVHSAKNLGRTLAGGFELTDVQQRILAVLEETGGISPKQLAERLRLTPADLERHVAALRHMEKVRGELREGRKYIRLW